MLVNLYIKNYALIEECSVDFQKGFNVISGETGAGKSIMLGGLSLILGKRADVSVLHDSESKCIVEGRFNIDESVYNSFFQKNNLDFEAETIIRREITPNGKSRGFINDTPVNLSVLKSFSEGLIELHSQHESLALKQSNHQFNLLDNFCNHQEELQEFRSEYQKLRGLKKSLIEFEESGDLSLSEIEFLRFQLQELENAQLKEGELQQIEGQLALLNNAEKIATFLEKGVNYLEKENGIIDSVAEIGRDFAEISSYNTKIAEISARLNQSVIELKDISTDIYQLNDSATKNPSELERLNARFDTINSLLLKHRKSLLTELIELKDSLKERLKKYEHYDAEKERLTLQIIKQEQKAKVIAKRISKSRKNAIENLQKEMESILHKLGMPFANFCIEIKTLESLTENGIDEVVFLFSANKGIKVEKLNNIISGGELSRLMLAVKYISAQHSNTVTLIFDEVDSGVSGEIANMMGEMMQEIGKDNQLISVTHLPQVAARGQHHFMIYKKVKDGVTSTLIKPLLAKDRVEEIAKLLSGKEVTETAKKNALELLNQ